MTEKEAKGKEMELYKKALEKRGNAAQKLMMIEEMPEFVRNMQIMQMKYIFPEWKYHKIRKLERLEGALKK